MKTVSTCSKELPFGGSSGKWAAIYQASSEMAVYWDSLQLDTKKNNTAHIAIYINTHCNYVIGD